MHENHLSDLTMEIQDALDAGRAFNVASWWAAAADREAEADDPR
jgi:hypothetical protein